ncbi:hypothetical protein N3K66_000032 [Trichothecium roseum]|uniref:Uncharacterized protein n=1 Tax=Trichothecium roseum TaxID=47278 RepID=A0ACC0VDG1_9HYPO|nr:hypothetical protein N3K66_000032 [Trichothecium roseum]
MALTYFAKELWIKYSIAIAVMLVRFGARLHTHGWRNFDGTDFWCALSTVLYTIVSSCDYILSTPGYPTNVSLDEKTAMEVPDDEVPAMRHASKIALFSWTMYLCMIFSFKGVVLCLMGRVGMGLWRQEQAVAAARLLVVACWAASILAQFCSCVPVRRFWQVKPYPGEHCTARPLNYWVAGLLNILTDFVIIVLPMPMLWRVRLPLRRKAALSLLFGSGALVMVCTILRNYYVLAAVTDEQLAQLWASREAFASMVVVSIPAIWSLVRKMGWLGHYDGGGGARGGGGNGSNGGGRALPGAGSSALWKSSASRAVGSQAGPDEFEMSLRIKGHNNHNHDDDEEGGRLGDGDSEDRIMVPGLSSMMSSQTSDNSIAGGGRGLGGGGGGVRVTTEYSVQFEHGGEDVAEHVKKRGMNWTSEYR